MKPIKLKNVTTFSYGMREALRTLKTNIKFSGDDMKVLMITSSAPNEGKSTVTMNLAKSMTESGNNVLVVDTDMRKSVLVARLQAETEDGEEIKGLSHYLSGQEAMDDCIYYTDTNRLCIMFAGPTVPNPTELLEKKYFEKLLEDAREKFDYVLLDTAPLGAAIDGAVVAGHADGTILVVAQSTESRSAILDVKSQIETAGGKIIGVVLNKVNVGKNGYSYGKYGYGRYYGRYYGKYEKKKPEDKKEKALKKDTKKDKDIKEKNAKADVKAGSKAEKKALEKAKKKAEKADEVTRKVINSASHE